MGKGKFGRGSARGARGGGKSMGISENTCFTAVHSSAADYFAFRIKWDALYIDVTYSTEKLYLPSFNRTLVV